VFQQYEVLNANLDYPIARFCGELIATMDSLSFWKQQKKQNMVIVCTADILLSCLHHSFLTLDDINLLIFDEAHHTKKSHPYARIIKDFYAEVQIEDKRRPRIFGMTASPVDNKTDIHTAAAQLEGLLQSEIATVEDPSVFRKSDMHLPGESVMSFDRIGEPTETFLWQQLHRLVGDTASLRKMFKYTKSCSAMLGPWCADWAWKVYMTQQEEEKLIARAELDLTKSVEIAQDQDSEAQISAIRKAYQTIASHPYAEATDTPTHVSNKTRLLGSILRSHLHPGKGRCIVFVEQRLTAVLLKELFERPGIGAGNVRPGVLVSHTLYTTLHS
jgi:endoribonuclease Dicer